MRRVLIERDRGAGPDIAGTVVLVTGASRGLGLLLVISLARAGASVGLIARSGAELAAVVDAIRRNGGTARAAAADITDPHATAIAVKQLTEQLGTATVLINNAGVTGCRAAA